MQQAKTSSVSLFPVSNYYSEIFHFWLTHTMALGTRHSVKISTDQQLTDNLTIVMETLKKHFGHAI